MGAHYAALTLHAMTTIAFIMILIALGANLPHPELGAPPAVFLAAIRMLKGRGYTLLKRSKVYHNPPVGPQDQPDYYNAALAMDGQGDPALILTDILAVEKELGRKRGQRWGPRILDLDLIAVGGQVVPSIAAWRQLVEQEGIDVKQHLILPHPRVHQRLFVLAPLMDIAPDWQHPILKLSVTELYHQIESAGDMMTVSWD